VLSGAKVAVEYRPVVVMAAKRDKGEYLILQDHLKLDYQDAKVILADLKDRKEKDPDKKDDDVFARPEDVAGQRLKVSLKAGDVVHKSDVETPIRGEKLQFAVEMGYRAMSVRVNEVINVAGFVVQGTSVDVIVTERPDQDSAARTLLTNIKVLSAGTAGEQQIAAARSTGKDVEKFADKPLVSTVVTLMVTPEQAEKLALAQNAGTITLALRNPEDQSAPVTPGQTMQKLIGQQKGDTAKRVEAIRGITSTQERVIR